jgi:hypothetical protein
MSLIPPPFVSIPLSNSICIPATFAEQRRKTHENRLCSAQKRVALGLLPIPSGVVECGASRNMKRILLKTPSGFYLQGIDRWTADPEQAFDFKVAHRALKFIDIWGLKNVGLAFALSGRNWITGAPLARDAGA